MRVIHFTRGACDRLLGMDRRGVDFAPLLEADGPTHVGCLHLSSEAVFDKTVREDARALLVVYGKVILREPYFVG